MNEGTNMGPAPGAWGPSPQAAGSVAAILRNQDRSGAFVASPDFPQYRYCWLRDGAFSAFALDCAGQGEASERFHRWAASTVSGIADLMAGAITAKALGAPLDPRKMPPARFTLAGAVVDDLWPNHQVDGYGTWLWSLREHLEAEGRGIAPELVPVVERTADYLVALGASPCYDPWEESGTLVHTATLACVYGGLRAAAALLGNGLYDDQAAQVKASLLARASQLGYFPKSDQDDSVDGALLWVCVPFGVVGHEDSLLVETVRRIVDQLEFDGGVRRYPGDTYYGSGAWPVLTAWLGWYYGAAGDLARAQPRLDWVAGHVDGQGRLAEQFGGEQRDPEHYNEWVQRWGPPAADLVWSHAMHVVLTRKIDMGGTISQATNTAEPVGPAPTPAGSHEL